MSIRIISKKFFTYQKKSFSEKQSDVSLVWTEELPAWADSVLFLCSSVSWSASPGSWTWWAESCRSSSTTSVRFLSAANWPRSCRNTRSGLTFSGPQVRRMTCFIGRHINMFVWIKPAVLCDPGNPRSLSHLSRVVIRKHLSCSGLMSLQLPNRLKDFLLFKENDLYAKIICREEWEEEHSVLSTESYQPTSRVLFLSLLAGAQLQKWEILTLHWIKMFSFKGH